MEEDKREIVLLKYSLIDCLGEIGGLYIVLELLFGLFTMFFSSHRLISLLANRLFREDSEELKMLQRLLKPDQITTSKKFRDIKDGTKDE
jgi:hypothetical protein